MPTISHVSFSIAMGVKYIDQYCAGTLDLSNLSGNANTILTSIADIEAKFTGYPAVYMCTDKCPCKPGTWYSQYTSTASVPEYGGKTVD
jgi:hypothetical protein